MKGGRLGAGSLKEKVVDRSAFDEGQFASDAGFSRLNKQFEGRLEQLMGELADDIWPQPDFA